MLALCVAGCAVGPNFKTPPPPPPAAFGPPLAAEVSAGPGEPVQRPAGAPAVDHWWRSFGSAEIDARVAEALAANYDIAASRARLAQAHEAAVQAGAKLFPAVDVTASVTRLTSSFLPQGIDERGGLVSDYLIGPNVSYAVDLFGGPRRLREQRGAQTEAAAYELQAAQLTVSGAVVRISIEAARLRTQLDAVEQILADDRKAVESVERLLAVHRRTIADLAAAQSQLAEDEALAPPLRQQLAVSATALAVLTGKTAGEAPVSDLRLEAIALPSDLPMSVPAELVRRRPDVRAAEAQLHASSAAIGVATARRLPGLEISGSITQESLSASRLFGSAATGGFLIASVTAPIFHAGELRSQQRQAVAAYDETAARYRQTVLTSVGQVADVLRALDHDAQAVAAESAAVTAAERAARAADAQFAVGTADILLVLKTRQDLGRARLRLAEARSQRLLDTVQLNVALGGAGVTPVR